MMNRRHTHYAWLLGLLAACAAPGGDDEQEDFDSLADQAPFGQISLEAHAQPPEGGAASVSVSAFGTVACTGAVCFSGLFSTPTWTATANAGWHFVRWEGCSAAGTSPTAMLGAVAQDERCNAIFEADAAPPPPPPPPEPLPQPPAPLPPPPAPDPVTPYDPDKGSTYPLQWTPEQKLSEKYNSLPEHVRGALGGTIGPVTSCDSIPGYQGNGCHFVAYEYGRIYTQPNGLTTEIHGAIYAAWLDSPESNPSNSSPISDEVPTADGRGAYSRAGDIFYWTPETGAWAVHWWTPDWWAQAGGGAGYWGYPKGPYMIDYDGVHCPKSPSNSLIAQEFEGGWVCSDWDRAWLLPNPKP
jgi:hypothetical protein